MILHTAASIHWKPKRSRWISCLYYFFCTILVHANNCKRLVLLYFYLIVKYLFVHWKRWRNNYIMSNGIREICAESTLKLDTNLRCIPWNYHWQRSLQEMPLYKMYTCSMKTWTCDIWKPVHMIFETFKRVVWKHVLVLCAKINISNYIHVFLVSAPCICLYVLEHDISKGLKNLISSVLPLGSVLK